MHLRSTRFLLWLALVIWLAGCTPSAARHAPTPDAPTPSAAATAANAENLKERAHQAIKNGDMDAAMNALQEMLARQPQSAWGLYQLGLLTYTQDPRAGLPFLQEAAALNRAYRPAAATLEQAVQDLPEAGDAALQDVPEAGEQALALVMAGRGLAAIDEWRLAEAALGGAVESAPDYAEAWAYLGEARQHQPAPAADAGLSELRQALALDPTSPAVRTLFSLYWQRHDQPERALVHQQAAVELAPDSPPLLAGLGALQAVTGDLASAQHNYSRAVELAPGEPAYLHLLAAFALDFDYQVAEIALPAAQEALRLAPDDPVYLDLLAHTLLQLGRLNEAESYLERALAADPNYVPAVLHEGMLHYLRGERAGARQAFEDAIRLEPDGPSGSQAERMMQLVPEE